LYCFGGVDDDMETIGQRWRLEIINCALKRTPMTGAQPVRRRIAIAMTPTGLFIFGEKGDGQVCLADFLKDNGGWEVV
jgi:hypothetical protein